MEWFRSRKTTQIPSDSEGKKMRQMAYAMLVNLPITQWKVDDSVSQGRPSLQFARTSISTMLENGTQVKIVRRVRLLKDGPQSQANPTLTFYRRYELFLDRILMGHENYPDKQATLENLGLIFESVIVKLTN